MILRTTKPYLLLLFSGLVIFSRVCGQDSSLSKEVQLQRENSARIFLPFQPEAASRKSNSPFTGTTITQPVFAALLSAERMQSPTCFDSSFSKVFEADNRVYTFLCSGKTKDGGMLLGGFGRSKLDGPPYKWYSVVTKFDSIGNHIWSKEIRSDVQTTLYIEGVNELADGSIIVTGWHENVLSSAPPTAFVDFFASKLNSTGDLIWLKTFHSLLGNGCTTSNIRFASIAEGSNGDIFIAGTITNCPMPKYLVVFKLNNAGAILWKYSFSDSFNESSCIGIFYEGSTVSVISRSYESATGSIPVDLMKLDQATGAFISNKTWKVNLPYPANFYAGFLNWTPRAVRLNNGNYCVFGAVFGDYLSSTSNQPHFSVVELNANFDFVSGYLINSSMASNPSESIIKVDRFGRAVYSLTTFSNWLNKTKHIGAVNKGLVVHQRKKFFSNMEIFYDNHELYDDGSFVYINTAATPGQDNFYLYYNLLHTSDTSGLCLGYADDFSSTSAVQYIPYNLTWVTINPNPLIETNNQNNSILPITYVASPPCYAIAYCDTLAIHGNPFSCNVSQNFVFTAYKNAECGSRVNWVVEDPSVVQSLQVVNDTTVNIRFNQSWEGWLYAEIITSCGLLRDSVFIQMLTSPGAVNIGPDTVICPLNTVELNAHSGYVSYLWNDGSTDSLKTVNMPGTYFVDVTDACGNFFTDTVIVSPAPPVPFSAGPDRTKCNNDTLHLVATPGFINYNWGPAYNISSLIGQQVIVNPSVDTFYYVRAEKTPGCFAYDTVRITVNNSIPVSLGPDRSFCNGDSVVFDAGSGFTQYLWNTGSTQQQQVAYNAGSFYVTATDINSCKSYDTVRVLNVWTNPVVNLNKDSTLCAGSSRTLQPGSFNSFLWQDGSTGPSYTISGTGIYYVTVTDNNSCAASDTVYLTKILPQPVSFLPADTSICNYGSLLLKPSQGFSSYLWSNGATVPSINISQPGIYWLRVSDANQCVGTDTLLVSPKQCLQGFFIPTAFTPNNDGLNDFFKPIIGGEIIQYRFTIYNRWGEVVFNTNEPGKGWDGRLSAVPQDTYVFAWTCNFQLEGGASETRKGTVLLIR